VKGVDRTRPEDLRRFNGVAGVILAAGQGRRFGEEPKQLADLGGRPVLEHVIEKACAVPALERVIVVLGARAEAILARVDLFDAEAVVCPDWAEGQAASLRFGLRELEGFRKVVVLLGDQPLVTRKVIARFANEPPGTRAAYGGVPGHPASLGPKLIRQALVLTGDEGLRSARWRLVECGHLASGTDIDTQDDLEAIRNEARAVVRG
jgi:molybdenum cofactor cytidylyltransferase